MFTFHVTSLVLFNVDTQDQKVGSRCAVMSGNCGTDLWLKAPKISDKMRSSKFTDKPNTTAKRPCSACRLLKLLLDL